MKRILASAALLVTLSVPTFAGWIDQTGRPCTPGGAMECIWVEDPSANLDTGSGAADMLDFIAALFGIA